MWFKQAQLFQLNESIAYQPEAIAEKLQQLAFTPCLPSFPLSVGWAPPCESDNEEAPLVHAGNGFILLCLQVEEKILPAAVIRQALQAKVKRIEKLEDRKVRQKDKLSLKDEVIMDLLPRAFTKMTRIYAYIDTKTRLLVLGTTSQTRTDQFITLFKRSFTEGFHAFDLPKLGPVMTVWLKNKKHPGIFSVEESCLLQDPNHENRMIRCQHQDLFAQSIQTFINEGCLLKQVALCWHERVGFVLADDFSLRSIKYLEGVKSAANEIEAENKQQQFDADFFIMSQTLSGMIEDLLKLFAYEEKEVKVAEPA